MDLFGQCFEIDGKSVCTTIKKIDYVTTVSQQQAGKALQKKYSNREK
jgi:hypothetical protein